MTKEEFRKKVQDSMNARRLKTQQKLIKSQSFDACEAKKLANEFADGAMEAMNEQIDLVRNELPENKRYMAKLEMLRESKRNIMVEEAMEQTSHRIHDKNQTGASLAVCRGIDTFLAWAVDGHDRLYAHQVVGNALKGK